MIYPCATYYSSPVYIIYISEYKEPESPNNQPTTMSYPIPCKYLTCYRTSMAAGSLPDLGRSANSPLRSKTKTCLSLKQVRYDDDDEDDGPVPDPAIEGGMPLPIRMAAEFPPELVATPIEDIDNFYADKKVRGGFPGFKAKVYCSIEGDTW